MTKVAGSYCGIVVYRLLCVCNIIGSTQLIALVFVCVKKEGRLLLYMALVDDIYSLLRLFNLCVGLGISRRLCFLTF